MNGFAHPGKNTEAFALAPGMHVADIGCGTGAYVLFMAHEVGAEGKVYAIDVQKGLLDKVTAEAHRRHLNTITTVWANADEKGGLKLRDSSLDFALLSNVLFQSEHKDNMVTEVLRVVKPLGRVAVIDWSESYGNLGPIPGHVVPEQVAREMFERHGATVDKTFSAGAHHYGIIFRKHK